MGLVAWLGNNWFTLLQSLGIMAGLVFTGFSFRADARARRVGSLLTITEHYRNIWTGLYQRPELARVLSASADVVASPLTHEEELLARLLILHLNAVFRAQKDRVILKVEGLEKDIQWFFALPLPKAVWNRLRAYQDRDFVAFVDACLKSGQPQN
jgi:hypothetical protein